MSSYHQPNRPQLPLQIDWVWIAIGEIAPQHQDHIVHVVHQPIYIYILNVTLAKL